MVSGKHRPHKFVSAAAIFHGMECAADLLDLGVPCNVHTWHIAPFGPQCHKSMFLKEGTLCLLLSTLRYGYFWDQYLHFEITCKYASVRGFSLCFVFCFNPMCTNRVYCGLIKKNKWMSSMTSWCIPIQGAGVHVSNRVRWGWSAVPTCGACAVTWLANIVHSSFENSFFKSIVWTQFLRSGGFLAPNHYFITINILNNNNNYAQMTLWGERRGFGCWVRSYRFH